MGFTVPEWWLELRKVQAKSDSRANLQQVGEYSSPTRNIPITIQCSLFDQNIPQPKETPLVAYGCEGDQSCMAGGWPFFFMMAKELIESGQALGIHYGMHYWRPILQSEKALKDKLDKLKVGINTKEPWFDGRELVLLPFPYCFPVLYCSVGAQRKTFGARKPPAQRRARENDAGSGLSKGDDQFIAS